MVILTMDRRSILQGYICALLEFIVYGEKISRVRPTWYTHVFITCDNIYLSSRCNPALSSSASTSTVRKRLFHVRREAANYIEG
ncbi:hypothetical protein DPV78_003482 [Talaromyces pinophilus]|nr:hypothetical protein DPV78_003482 [Talaromyces pinophilus]